METKTLKETVSEILDRLRSLGYSEKTIIKMYEPHFNTLLNMAENLGKDHLDESLKELYLYDTGNRNRKDEYCHSRYLHHQRCIQFLESWLETEKLDLSKEKSPQKSSAVEEFADAEAMFEAEMESCCLATATRRIYRRTIIYYNLYLEGMGYTSYLQLDRGASLNFFSWLCTEYNIQPTSLGAYRTGLRKFFRFIPELSIFLDELPRTLMKNTPVEVYSDEEKEKLLAQECSGRAPLRDKAIVALSMNTGMRSVDIINLKLDDIDWRKSTISIIQQKTKRRISIPIEASVGNPLAMYIRYERPQSKSREVFLTSYAPYRALDTSSAIWEIIHNTACNAGIDGARPAGTRIARHSHASALVRAGVALPLVSQALGHSSMNTTMIYITTDSEGMAECCLHLPSAGGSHAE